MSAKFLTVLLAATALTACTMAPRYERPASPVAANWPASVGLVSEAEAKDKKPQAADISWRSMFGSPTLQKLIEESLANNRDLRVATLNIEAARAQYRIQRADLLPGVNATGSGTRQRVPENANTLGTGSQITSNYSAGLGITSYEIDLFGRVRSLSRRAFNQYMATEEARTAAQISLVAEVTNAYLTYLADKELLQLT
ncbi:MAG: multidrug transporter, partial [Pseudomonas fluorescens]